MSTAQSIPPVDARPIPRVEGYLIRDGGEVWSCRNNNGKLDGAWHILVPHRPSKGGYIQIGLRLDGKNWQPYVHCLVLEVFVGPCPEGMEACHNDGNPANNFASNLRWDTRAANVADKQKHGTEVRGEKQHKARLREPDIAEILRLGREGHRIASIARTFGVGHTTIGHVLARRTWKHVAAT